MRRATSWCLVASPRSPTGASSAAPPWYRSTCPMTSPTSATAPSTAVPRCSRSACPTASPRLVDRPFAAAPPSRLSTCPKAARLAPWRSTTPPWTLATPTAVRRRLRRRPHPSLHQRSHRATKIVASRPRRRVVRRHWRHHCRLKAHRSRRHLPHHLRLHRRRPRRLHPRLRQRRRLHPRRLPRHHHPRLQLRRRRLPTLHRRRLRGWWNRRSSCPGSLAATPRWKRARSIIERSRGSSLASRTSTWRIAPTSQARFERKQQYKALPCPSPNPDSNPSPDPDPNLHPNTLNLTVTLTPQAAHATKRRTPYRWAAVTS